MQTPADCGIVLHNLQEAIDTASGGQLVFYIFAAEFERALIRERT